MLGHNQQENPHIDFDRRKPKVGTFGPTQIAMDSRDASIQSRQPPQGMMMTTPFAFGQHLPNNPVMMGGANSNLMVSPSFSFNSMSAPKPFDSGLVGHQQQQQQQQHHQQQNGSPASGVGGAAAAGTPFGSEQGKKKRGRPRKYSPDGGIGLGLSSNSQVASMAAGGGSGAGGQNELCIVNVEGSQEKKRRGRPPGSGKKQLDALGGPGGVGFTPHVIMISTGEFDCMHRKKHIVICDIIDLAKPKLIRNVVLFDIKDNGCLLPKTFSKNIVSKMVEFSQEGPRTICILSANGAVEKVILRQPVTGAGTASYEGPFEIISLSGSFCCVNSDGSHNDTINLTVSLARPDGKVLGGGVAGELIAATAVQIVAGSFIADKKKSDTSAPIASPLPTSVPHMLIGGSGSATPNNPTQLDAASDSSDDNGGGGGHSLNHTPGPYNNANHPMHGMQMYQAHMGWGSSGIGGMHHNR